MSNNPSALGADKDEDTDDIDDKYPLNRRGYDLQPAMYYSLSALSLVASCS